MEEEGRFEDDRVGEVELGEVERVFGMEGREEVGFVGGSVEVVTWQEEGLEVGEEELDVAADRVALTSCLSSSLEDASRADLKVAEVWERESHGVVDGRIEEEGDVPLEVAGLERWEVSKEREEGGVGVEAFEVEVFDGGKRPSGGWERGVMADDLKRAKVWGRSEDVKQIAPDRASRRGVLEREDLDAGDSPSKKLRKLSSVVLPVDMEMELPDLVSVQEEL